MPADLFLPALAVLAVALTASAMELRAAMRPPVCSRCVHCRHEAIARREREAREHRLTFASIWRLDDKDDEERRRR